ncbi:MAG: hypothetical protein J0H78_04990 [Rhizobiales bacterium]|nr:hypothetical protein [Hyphomicrobiales bacterium]OJY41367.1 MAG: hypothetical protein BGP08_04595 [Rhizobiales bacterium 64-17]
MSALKSLVFAPLPKLSGADPVQHRRNKLIERLRQQISLANDPAFALTRQKWVSDGNGGKNLLEQRKRVRPWWRMDGSGNVVLTVRYGARPIEFDKGKAAIAVGKKDKLVSTIETVISAVEAGELDAAIGHMSKTAVQLKSKKAA